MPEPQPPLREKKEPPAFYKDTFVNVTEASIGTKINDRFENNDALREQFTGWPNPDESQICLFSVPPAQDREKQHSETTVTRLNHWGMGRGLSILLLPLPGSHLAERLGKDSVKAKIGLIGIPDHGTGNFYTRLGLKGNGPTANEIKKTTDDPTGAGYRRKKNEAWGLLWEQTAIDIEQTTLEQLADLGFRVGRVLSTTTLDKTKLAQMVEPFYISAGLEAEYSIRDELKKLPRGVNPAIISRLGGGVRADVLSITDAKPQLIDEGIYCLASEINLLTERTERGEGKTFQEKFKLPDSYQINIETLKNFDFSPDERANYLYSYFRLICFLMWRNFHLQDEYNRAHGDPKHDGLGPIWLNYKPGDWDVGGYIFDVDVFVFKRDLSKKIGESKVRKTDAEGLAIGLGYIQNKINQELPQLPIQDVISRTYHDSLRVSQEEGFLEAQSQQNFYNSG